MTPSWICRFLAVTAAVLDGALAFGGVFPAYRSETIDIRGKAQSLAIYDAPADPPHHLQVIVTSGDLGWIGLSVDIAEFARSKGYKVVGFNARAYLASFTSKNNALTETDVAGDYAALLEWAAGSGPGSVVLVGVSEGAGLSALAVAHGAGNRCKGMVALGLPEKTSLGWRWTDFPMWITKKDPKEPMAEIGPLMNRFKVPLVMIHSTHDEWDPVDRIRQMFQLAPYPKRFIAVDAANHRFSDRIPEVLQHVGASLVWIESLLASAKGSP